MKLFAVSRDTFPDPAEALDEGVLAISDDLRVERLLEAYSFGIFPWPQHGMPTLWFSPPERGVIDFKDFSVPQSVQKFIRKADFTISFNRAFAKVIEACAVARRARQKGTWITPSLLKAYIEFHRAGYAHSLEVWSGTELAGGLYGVYVGGVFCGESMFFLKPNASKFALVKLVEFLAARGMTWMDIQMVTPLSKMFGGRYISREEFLQRLEKAKPSAKRIEFKI